MSSSRRTTASACCATFRGSPAWGARQGVVVYYNERRDAFISVENETEDYYYPMRDDETLQPGDRVTFFVTGEPALQAAAQRRQNDDGRQRAVCGRSALLPGPRRGQSHPAGRRERHDAVRTHRGGRRQAPSPVAGDHHALRHVEPAVVGHFRLGKREPRVPSSSPRASGIST